MRPARDHDKQLARITRLADTFGKLHTLTGAPDLFGDTIRPHLDQAAALRTTAATGAEQATALADRLPEQVATGAITLDQAVTHLTTCAVWATPIVPGGTTRAAVLAEQAARCHEAAAIGAARDITPHLYATLVPFAQGAVTAADTAARALVDVPGLAAAVRDLRETYGGFRTHVPNTPDHLTAWRTATGAAQLLALIYSTSAGLVALEGRNVDAAAVTFAGPVDPHRYQFLHRNVDEAYRIAIAVELGWKPGYYPPTNPAARDRTQGGQPAPAGAR
jgi:hypothetical protein